MRSVLAVLFLPALLRADDDGEKRIRAMEKKLESAKTIQVTFDARAEGLRESGTFKGILTVTEGNKMHLEGSVAMGGKKVSWKNVSDGTRMHEEGPERISRTTSKTLTADYRRSLTHGGFLMGTYLSSSGGDGQETWPVFHVSDFELGKPDNVGTRRAQIVACKLIPTTKRGESEITFTESIWFDLETGLPLKRTFTGTLHAKEIKFTETYEKFVLDPKIDEKLFELPK